MLTSIHDGTMKLVIWWLQSLCLVIGNVSFFSPQHRLVQVWGGFGAGVTTGYDMALLMSLEWPWGYVHSKKRKLVAR
jgi:hypothetical protein